MAPALLPKLILLFIHCALVFFQFLNFCQFLAGHRAFTCALLSSWHALPEFAWLTTHSLGISLNVASQISQKKGKGFKVPFKCSPTITVLSLPSLCLCHIHPLPPTHKLRECMGHGYLVKILFSEPRTVPAQKRQMYYLLIE